MEKIINVRNEIRIIQQISKELKLYNVKVKKFSSLQICCIILTPFLTFINYLLSSSYLMLIQFEKKRRTPNL